MDLYEILEVILGKNEYICFELSEKEPPEVFYENSILENFAKFTEKHLCLVRVYSLIKLQALDLQSHLKRDSGTGVFL